MEGYRTPLKRSGAGEPVLCDKLLSLSGETPTKMCRSALIADQAIQRTGGIANLLLQSQSLGLHLNGSYQLSCANDTGHTLDGW
jgi:hypothetical protein